MEISIKWNICRICLQEEKKLDNAGQMRNIFDEEKKLVQHIYDCSGITMKPNDSLPDKICQKCLAMLNNAINFRKTCRSSNTYLQSILQRTKAASTLFKPEGLHIESSDKEDVSKLETLKPSDVITDQCVEHSPNVRDKNKSSNIKIVSNIKDSEYINKMTKSEIISKTELQLFDDFIEHSEEIEDEIIQVYKTQANITSNSKHVTTNTKSRKMSEKVYNKISDYVYETDIEQLEENSEELYYTGKEAEEEDSLLSPKHNHISEDELSNEYEDETIISEDNFEYLDIEENNVIDDTVMLRLEGHEIDDNQAQVSSTVEAIDLLNLHEKDSDLSNAAHELMESKNCKEEKYINKESFLKHANVVKSNTIQTESRKIRGLRNITVRTSTVALGKHNIKHKNFKSFSDNKRFELQVYVCKICGNQFSNRQNFYLHKKKHRQERNHQCELCFKCFFTASNLQAHMRIHTGEKPFECQYCGRKFSDRSSNLRHERIHTKEKPFQCNYCCKSFALTTTLQSHIKIHTGERSYRCEPCGKSFKLPHHLKKHQMTTLHKAVQELRNKYN